MPSSHFEYIFYSLCLRAEVPTFPFKQDVKQDINKNKIKNIDFICYSGRKIYLIDVKGLSNLSGDTKVSKEDLNSMKTLTEIYGENAKPLFVYIWIKKKIDQDLEKDLLLQKFRVKAISLDEFNKNMVQQKGWGDKFYRCNKALVKDIWEFIPNFKELIDNPNKLI